MLVPPGLGYAAAAGQLRRLLGAGVPVGAVLAAGDEGVLIANRLGAPVPVLDQVDTAAAGACPLLAVEVRPPGQPLTMLTDPVALGAALHLGDREAADAVTLSRLLLDYSNAVIGLAGPVGGGPVGGGVAPGPGPDGPAGPEPWLVTRDRRVPLREACAGLAGWPPGSVSALGTAAGETPVDDLFALDLARVADTATARQGSTGRTVLVASLHRAAAGLDHVALLGELLGRPVHCLISEPAAARLGARTTPGARADAVVVDVGRGHHRRDRAGRRGGGGRRRRPAHRGRGRDRLACRGPRPTGSSGAPACGSPAASSSRPRTAAAASWTGPRRPPCSACWPRPAQPGCCRSTGGTARPSGGPSGSGSRRRCSRPTCSARSGR